MGLRFLPAEAPSSAIGKMRCVRCAAFAVLLTAMGATACTSSAFAAAAGPSCAEGPQTAAGVTTGTPCADVIVAPAGVETVRGGGGDDTIIAAPLTAATPFPGEEWLGVGSQTFEGGPGDDVVFGERGNDTLSGNEGNDRLYGGIGDDLLRGGPGQDQLAGGHGADSIDGDAGDDYVRGDGTIDRIFDTGGGTDTLSYSTGITPGFGGDMSAFPGFPAPDRERGVRIDLGGAGQNANNGTASFGGGVDEVEGPAFEQVIGTAFSDYIVGTAGPETIYGGGGADVIIRLRRHGSASVSAVATYTPDRGIANSRTRTFRLSHPGGRGTSQLEKRGREPLDGHGP
jgi:Ca2+-binding RTX toxin-like protein